MRIYAVRYTGGVALAWLPIYQQIISKGLEDSRCGHRLRECVQTAVLWTDCELAVALVNEQRTLPTFHGCTQILFQTSAPARTVFSRIFCFAEKSEEVRQLDFRVQNMPTSVSASDLSAHQMGGSLAGTFRISRKRKPAPHHTSSPASDTEEEDTCVPYVYMLSRCRYTTRSGRTEEEKGEQSVLWHKLKGDGCETVCTGTRDTQCVYVPYVLSVSLE